MLKTMVAAFGVLLGASLVAAETTELTPIKDNTLYEDEEGRFSNGAGQYLFAGNTAKNFLRRGLVAFDVFGALPPGATVESAELIMQMSRSISEAEDVELRRLLADWGEGESNASVQEGAGTDALENDATWTHAFSGGVAWALPGGVFAETVSAVQTIDEVGSYRWGSTDQSVSDVQGWLDDPEANFGWVILGNEESATTTKRFDSREHEDPTVRPVLRIEFATPSATAVATRTWGSVKVGD